MRSNYGVVGDRSISRKHKGNVLTSCVSPAYMYGPETMELTEKKQEKLQLCKEKL